MRNPSQGIYRLSVMARWLSIQFPLVCLFSLSPPLIYANDNIGFNPEALKTGHGMVADLTQFERGEQLPGTYRVDIYLNNTLLDTRDVTFTSHNGVLEPQLTAGYWRDLGFKKGAFPTVDQVADKEIIADPSMYVPQAATHLDLLTQRLDISIPQAALTFRPRDYISPQSWDDGVTAGLLNYDLNASKNWIQDSHSEYSNLYLRLDSGLNFGAWRLRNNAVYTQSRGSYKTTDWRGHDVIKTENNHSWQNQATYLQRDIASWQSRLTLGDTYTPSGLYDSVQFRGVQLETQDSMIPDSMRGYAPVVRGIARSNALVTVRQNGGVIYQTNVAPGAFEIRDLYPTSSSGNLDVTVRESDGRETTFVQPFSAVPGMQREGQFHYALSGGKYRSWASASRKPEFMLGTIDYGVASSTSLAAGGIYSDKYWSGLLGVGQGLGVMGSLSLDLTYAHTQIEGQSTRSGHSWRAQYSKDLTQSGTSFVLAGYRYSTSGYYDFREANELLPRDNGEEDSWYNWQRVHNKRSRMEVQLSQQLGDYGSLNLTAYQQDYWNSSGKEQTFMLGYNLRHNDISYGLNLSETHYPESNPNRSIYFNVDIPLDSMLAGSRVSYSLNTDNHHRVRNQVGLSGQALQDNRLNWSVSEGYENQGSGESGSLSASYNGSKAQVNGSYSHDKYSQQVNGGIRGGVVVHPYGVTLSRSLGDTITLVRAPGAGDIGISNQQGLTTDSRGYAVVPYATAYHKNTVQIQTDTLADNVDIDSPSQTVIPTTGAVVIADFNVRTGDRVLAHMRSNGKPLPFGASVNLRQGKKLLGSSFVGEDGEVYLSGVPEQSQVEASWGQEAGQQCHGDVILQPKQASERFRSADINCR
jgi:outer membrane usher protein